MSWTSSAILDSRRFIRGSSFSWMAPRKASPPSPCSAPPSIICATFCIAFVDSSITLAPAAAQVQTSLERPLAGQSKNLFNAVFEAGSNGPVTGRLLYNFFGARISDVGSLGLPDIYEDSRGSLDLVLSGRWRALHLRFSAENLTDEAYTFTQDDLLQREYTLGRSFSFGVGVNVY